jgi:ergothioneine biosynthesis protein EgtB
MTEPSTATLARPSLAARFRSVRTHSDLIAAGLSAEDQTIQSMPDASPAKWHRAHTTWFFEQFVLLPNLSGYLVYDPAFQFLFNSYYETVGARHPRPARGILTRPGVAAVDSYRRHVDAAMAQLLATEPDPALRDLVLLGLQHEQQHQELLATDMLHGFAQNPLAPALWLGWQDAPAATEDPARWIALPGGLVELGVDAGEEFAFDNETPRHRAFLAPYRLANRLVNNADFCAFIADGGYRTPTLWMSDGWALVQAEGWQAPLYWRAIAEPTADPAGWLQFGPGGLQPLVPGAPLRHISWYEADAYARWAGARLPTEAEWEAAATDARFGDMTGRVWQWSNSAYLPYPGFRAPPGAIGEYNGKFMINQMVLRGSSIATPAGHARPTYRNFFHPDKRWQFAGLRLAEDS